MTRQHQQLRRGEAEGVLVFRFGLHGNDLRRGRREEAIGLWGLEVSRPGLATTCGNATAAAKPRMRELRFCLANHMVARPLLWQREVWFTGGEGGAPLTLKFVLFDLRNFPDW